MSKEHLIIKKCEGCFRMIIVPPFDDVNYCNDWGCFCINVLNKSHPSSFVIRGLKKLLPSQSPNKKTLEILREMQREYKICDCGKTIYGESNLLLGVCVSCEVSK